jgi:sn-glycerol 3-phosphate transport system permease protein
MDRRTVFREAWLPAAMMLPQLALTAIFFVWPAADAIRSSLFLDDPFGLNPRFVGLENFAAVLASPLYAEAAARTALFVAAVTGLSMTAGFGFAVLADRVGRGGGLYRALLTWPYAVAPAMAGVAWLFLMHPQIGLAGRWLNRIGLGWDYGLNGGQAMLLVILAASWRQVAYNFLFYLAGLQSIPRPVLEAARIDGAGEARLLRAVVLPLLAPTTLFLAVANVVYAAFDTFATVAALTDGGPGRATETLVFKVYRDGVVNLDIGASSAQSVILMLGVTAVTAVQFRLLGGRPER